MNQSGLPVCSPRSNVPRSPQVAAEMLRRREVCEGQDNMKAKSLVISKASLCASRGSRTDVAEGCKKRRASAPNADFAACLVCAAATRSHSVEPPTKAKEACDKCKGHEVTFDCQRVDPQTLQSDASLPAVVQRGWCFEKTPEKRGEWSVRYWRCYTVQLNLSAAFVRSESFFRSLGSAMPLFNELWREVLSFALNERPVVHFVIDKKVDRSSNQMALSWAPGARNPERTHSLVRFESGLSVSPSRQSRWEERQSCKLRRFCTQYLGLSTRHDPSLVVAMVDAMDCLNRGPVCMHEQTKLTALCDRVLQRSEPPSTGPATSCQVRRNTHATESRP